MTGIFHWENWKEIHDSLEDIEFRIYGSGDDEITYIDEVVRAFRGVDSSFGGERVRTKVYKTHGYPRAEFFYPSQPDVQRCEIADLCLDFEVEVNGTVEERFALLSQSKISKENNETWTVNLTQHYFLTFFPPFKSPNLGGSSGGSGYHLHDPRNEFANYSLASKHDQPLYCSCVDVGRRLSNWNYTQHTSTYDHAPGRRHLSTTVGLTSSLVNGKTGADLLTSSNIEGFVDDLIDYASGKSTNPQPDGGEVIEFEEEGFAVVRILVSREE